MSGGGRRLADLRALARQLASMGPERSAPESAARLVALCDRIEADTTPPGPAETRLAAEVSQTARRNLRRLGATLAGLRAAQALLEATRGAAAQTHATYGPAGQVRPLAPAPAQLERRS